MVEAKEWGEVSVAAVSLEKKYAGVSQSVLY
jgi:hypothetical protein